MIGLGVRPNTVVFNSIINVFAANGDLGDAEDYFALMSEFGVAPDVQTFNSLINACSSASAGDRLDRAEFWFTALVRSRLRPDEHTFNTLIATAANAQSWEKGFGFFHKMAEYGVYSNMQAFYWEFCGF